MSFFGVKLWAAQNNITLLTVVPDREFSASVEESSYNNIALSLFVRKSRENNIIRFQVRPGQKRFVVISVRKIITVSEFKFSRTSPRTPARTV